MLLRSLLRSAAGATASPATLRNPSSLLSDLLSASSATAASAPSRVYSTKAKNKATTTSKGKVRVKSPRAASADSDPSTAVASDSFSDGISSDFVLPTDPLPPTYDPALDVGPGGRHLFSFTKSFGALTRKEACTYVDLSLEDWNAMLPEGLPQGMTKEFEETRRCAVMVRHCFLELRDNFRRIVDPPLRSGSKNTKKQILLDGPVSCGKSIALAMLVHWARSEGWLVFYVPKGKEWSHGGFFYKNTHAEFLDHVTGEYKDLWDTPTQASKILQDFLKFNESQLQQLPCQVADPIPLGEGAGVGPMKGADSMAMPDGSTLFDLVQTGITYTHAAVGVVVRLRKELSMVKNIPVLFAIDQYNSWFTFSEYGEPATARSCRPIHARELSTVNAYRSMMHDDMMVGAFSHSTAVGKLRLELPDVPLDARVMIPRYTLDEAATVCHYYVRQRLIRRETFTDERWKKIYYLSNGNGSEMRWLAPFV